MSGYKVSKSLLINELYTLSKQRFSDGYFFGGESHSYFEVVYVVQGRVGITAGKDVYYLDKGQLTLHRPHEFHAIWEEGMTCPEVIILTFSATVFPKIKGRIYTVGEALMDEIEDIYRASKESFIMIGGNRCYGRDGVSDFQNGIFIDGVLDGKEAEAERFVKRLEIFLSSALECATDEKTEQIYAGSENYVKILSVMEDNINNNLSASDIARLAGMSVPTLEKTVYKYMHCGAIAYYNALRLERARVLIKGGASVKDAADALGYSNQNYFSACFKKRYGYPPSEAKKSRE